MQEPDIQALAARYQGLLAQDDRSIGKTTQDAAGNLDFTLTLEGLNVLFLFAENDVNYVRMLLPNFYSLDLDDDKVNALVAMNHVNTTCKVAKVNMNDKQDNVVASVEYLDSGAAVTQPVLERYLVMLIHTGSEFGKKMQALQSADAP
jgi:hypothetical protein